MSLLDAFIEEAMEESNLHAESVRREVWFAIRSDGQKGTGTRENPYNGSEVLVPVPNQPYSNFQFDNILRDEIPENTVIHLGPGIFKTAGGDTGSRHRPLWLPKSGQKIVGSGMFQTTLKLSLQPFDTADGQQPSTTWIEFPAISNLINTEVTDFEVSDLTIDCDLGGQPASPGLDYARISVNAVVLYGNRLAVRRVRVINWGKKGSTAEDFVIFLFQPSVGSPPNPQFTAEEMANTVEDCIIEQPDWNTGGQVSVITAPVVRNCLIRSDRVRPGPFPKIPVTRLTYTSTTATLETPFAHQFKAGERIVVEGVLADGQPSSIFNGAFTISTVPSLKTLTYSISNPGSPVISGAITVERESKPTLLVKSLTSEDSGSGFYYGKLETFELHRRSAGEWIAVSGVLDNEGRDNRRYNGAFKVESVESNGKILRYKLPGTGSEPAATGEIWLDRITKPFAPVTNIDGGTFFTFLGSFWPDSMLELLLGDSPLEVTTGSPHYRAPGDGIYIWSGDQTVDGYYKVVPWENHSPTKFQVEWTKDADMTWGRYTTQTILNWTQAITGNRIIEGNRMFHVQKGVYHDTWTYSDMVIRRNYVYGAIWGVFQRIGGIDEYYVPARTGSAQVIGNVITITSAQKHGFKDGAIVQINNAADEVYVGTFRVRVITEWVFTCTGTSCPQSVKFYEFFQCWRSIVEDNIFDLVLRPAGCTSQDTPWGIGLSGYGYIEKKDPSAEYFEITHNLAVRRNLIRQMGGFVDPQADPLEYGIITNVAGGILLQDNVIDVKNGLRSMNNTYPTGLQTVCNISSDGRRLNLLESQWPNFLYSYPDLADEADDAYVFF